MKKIIGIIFIVLVAFFIGFHFYVAHEASEMIDQALQKQAKKSGATIDYSDIDISPFRGNIEFSDLNYIQSSTIVRASHITFDLGYIDFLRIYFAGADYAFQHIRSMRTIVENPSLLFRKSIREYKSRRLTLDYDGNMLEFLQNAEGKQPLSKKQSLAVRADSTSFSTGSGGFKIDSLYAYAVAGPPGKSVFEPKNVEIKSWGLHWNPPDHLKETYGFFIRGFEYEPDNLPADSLIVQSSSLQQKNTKKVDLDLYTDLFHGRAITDLKVNYDSLSTSTLLDGRARIVDTSDRFRRLLKNAEALFKVNIPIGDQDIITFSGPVTQPDITFTGKNTP